MSTNSDPKTLANSPDAYLAAALEAKAPKFADPLPDKSAPANAASAASVTI